VASIDAMKEEGIVENAKRIGETVLGPGLRELADRHPVIGEVRGLGVFWALDLVSNRETREPLAPYGGTSPAMNDLVAAWKEAGTAQVAEQLPVDALDGDDVARLAASLAADLVVIGPEAPLAAGVADAVRAKGIACFGPSRAAAQIEGSKAFAKDVMAAAGVPT